ncbi:MYXO-CTERM sorting domain-containing protein [Myxococcus sp. RHSTA-1-4]|uniref:MYXO-CTERM sorting domain-containing protein n=1 Tax=Myxococcus sp. RHSTA-1-4 TaxID=2874601 RepID=UPI001CBCBDC3|nr:MYXO-CTERM sorting domain-containing protein [Myxococcus sp. RHSTA-1-4]MBZ4417836.1 hypothetical protein [Myxococcus sp. RHSTA-1-4]
MTMKQGMLSRWCVRGSFGLLAALGLYAPGAGADGGNRLCFRDVSGVPYTRGPPTLDGKIQEDKGWTGAFRYEFGNGTTSSHAVVQGVRDSGNVYISVEANNDPSFDENDVVVLAFDLGGGANRYRRLHLFPLYATGAAADGRMREAQYWQSGALNPNGTVNWGTVQIIPHGDLVAGAFFLDAKVTSSDGGPNNRTWSVEMRIPSSGLPLPPAADFKMYFDIFRVDGLTSTTPSLHWPTNANPPPGDAPDINNRTPAPANWGIGSFGTSGCTGVSISATDIRTNNSPSHVIQIPGTTASNKFQAVVRNSGADAAPDVRATFKIANFGLPSEQSWRPVPAPGNPTEAPGLSVPALGSQMLETGSWILTGAVADSYEDNRHQCILVELSSGSDRTTFTNRSAYVNMDFSGSASVFERKVEISTRGYALPPGATAHRIRVDTNQRRNTVFAPGGLRIPISQLEWLFHGYQDTGAVVSIRGKTYRVVSPIGSFGYIIKHKLTRPLEPVERPELLDDRWRIQLDNLRPEIRLRALPRLDLQRVPVVERQVDVAGAVAITRPPEIPLMDAPRGALPVAGTETPASYFIDIPAGESVQMVTRAEFPDEGAPAPSDGGTEPGDGGTGTPTPNPDPCGCRRTPASGTMGLLGLTMLALMAQRRRRRDDE